MESTTENHAFAHDEIAYGAFCIYKEEQRRRIYGGKDAHWFTAIDRLQKIRSGHMTPVVAYHACPIDFARGLWSGEITVEEWMESTQDYDWLGRGIYFWENGLRRAQEWAAEVEGRKKVETAVVRVTVDLGRCLDLTNTAYRDLIRQTYESLDELHREEPELEPMPENRGDDQDQKMRYLDCYVIDQFVQLAAGGILQENGEFAVIDYQTVRCSFDEGAPLFPGSGIKEKTHTQLAVRDRSCILAVCTDNYRRHVGPEEELVRAFLEMLPANTNELRDERIRLGGREVIPGVVLFD